MIRANKVKAALWAAFAALFTSLVLTTPAVAVPVLGLDMERTTTPLHRGDERLVYELTVQNEATSSPSPGDELTCRGTPEDGTQWFASPLATFTYKWLRDGTAIDDAEAKTYTVVAEDEGATLQCVVTGTNDPDGPGGIYAPISASFPSSLVAVAPVSGPILSGGGSRPSLQPILPPLSAPQGTATVTADSNALTDVITAKGTGILTEGSKLVTGVVTSSGTFAGEQEVSGAGIQLGTTVAKVISPTEIELSTPATESNAGAILTAGALPFFQGQEITGAGIPPGTTIITRQAGDPKQTLRLSAPATESEMGVTVTGFSKKVCGAPSGWSGDGAISWSFRWLRNGQPIPGANSDTYVVQEADTEPPSNLQCEATATDAAGNRAIAISGVRPTEPSPEAPYVSPRLPNFVDPVIDFANQTSGPVTLEFEPQGGVETYVFAARSGGGWDCVKQAPSAVNNALATCTREDPLSPGDSYPAVEMIVAVSKNAPEEVVSKVQVEGGGSESGVSVEDEFTLGPPVPWDFDAFEAKAVDELGNDYVIAGGHPFSAFAKFSFTDHERVEASEGFKFTRAPNGYARLIQTDIPPGFIGNPQAPPEHCPTIEDVLRFPGPTTCPPGSVVGGITIETGLQTFPGVPIYSIEPERGAPAEFAFGIAANNLAFALVPEIRAESGYSIRLVTAPIGKWPEIFGAEARLCGYGGKLGLKPEGEESSFEGCKEPNEAGANPIPLMTNPTRCEGPPPTTRIAADTWDEPGVFVEAKYAAEPVEGCENVPFEPEVSFEPTSNQADSPTGLDVSIEMPTDGLLTAQGIAQGALKHAVVTLPEGMTVNPSAADGLDACTSAQIGLGTDKPVGCPDGSKVGTVEVKTPLLEETLDGAVYLAKQADNPFGSLLALYLVVESKERGILVKLPGKVTPTASGRLITSFDDNPQVPFESIELHFPGGDRASLINPPACGTHRIVSELSPWSTKDPDAPTADEIAKETSTFKVSRGPAGSPCPKGELSPSFRAGVTEPIAAAKSPFLMSLSRPDGSKRFSALEVDLPPGLAAYLRGVPYCPDSTLAAISSAIGTGASELASPSCPEASKVGSVSAGAGAGPTPFYVDTGRAYLAGPYKGAPLSVAVIAPAVAGPFDLGTVVVRTALRVDPVTARVSAISDPIPTALHGIPLDVREVRIAIDRPQFTVAPTNCEAMSVDARITGEGASKALADRFQVGGCERLRFKPRLKIRLKGGTKRGDYQRLQATLTAKEGEANIASASVTLPRSAFLAQEHIRTVCTRVQFAAEQCPKGSIYGKAKAITPLLDVPLEGPVYLRSSNNKLPDLVVALKGPDSLPIEIELAGRTDSKKGALRNTFDLVPDAPVSKFTLELFGGRKGLVVNSRNLCASKQRAGASLTAHNGKERTLRPLVGNGCKGEGRKRKAPRPGSGAAG